ncbi:chromatin assembly factor 1 subunit A [Cricetulus griseus]|uniref:Chromatin assembly factor 1 subunit A n=1 Tax=Cricetulus griseus TaxID=10029 RepID=A0A061I4W3_CRIGR|nr:chromatin assembly factor 1 subunit A [Cricetulus griseus]
MLEEPDAATPPAVAMDCKDRPGFPVKRLIQARLPFKRLNLDSKEKAKDTSPKVSVEDKVPDLQLSLDTLENRCHTGSHVGLSPKLVGGRGPIDSFLKATVKPVPSMVIIDLTENSSDIPDCPEGSSEPSPDAPVEGANKLQGPSTGEQCPPETSSDIPCHTEEPGSQGGPERTGDCQAGSLQSCPKLTAGSRTFPIQEPSGWSKAGDLLFIEKVPVVVLEDILTTKPLHTSLPTTSLERSVTSESEVLESCPEDDSTLSLSSTSSSSPTSSPEGPSAPPAQLNGTSPHSTPICKVNKKLVRGSTEKGRSKLHRDREQQREEKEKLREETRQAKEEARRRKEEEKELKEKERREKREKDEKEKAEKQRLKEERRKERQEALEKKEEEKRLREEEKRIKAEKAEITRFFQKPKTPQAPKTLAGSCGKFAPFEIKEHMVLAPRCRATLDQDLCDRLDQLLQQQSGASSFLSDLKGRLPLRSGPTQVCSRNTNIMDRVIVESKVDGVPDRRRFGRMKLLQFSENHRPAYWGTWNKKTVVIRPRDPWAQDKNLLDYEVDSDEEWEEEEPGESLSHSEGDEDDDVGEDEDEDDGFFVPHGYLSEDEDVTEECSDPENHKVRQRLKAKEWDELLAKGKRFRVLQPVQVGCVWAAEAANCASSDLKLLQQFTACLLDAAPPEEPEPKASSWEKRNQHILAQLLPLLHGNVNGSKVIIREFQERCRRGLLSPTNATSHPQTPNSEDTVVVPSKARLKRLISENSAYEKRPDFRMCWYVHPQVLRRFGQECLPVPCQWTYVTAVPSTPREDNGNASTEVPGQGTPMPIKRKPAATMCITQFMKKRRYDGQVGSGDMDGFQVDTEEDEDDDTDCVIVDVSEAPMPAPTPCK